MDNLMLRRRVLLGLLNEEYIVFADPVVEQICATNWGDGIGLKPSQAARVTSTQFENKFKNNTSIVSFEEIIYFTGLTTLENGVFSGCTNLVNISIPSWITHVGNDLLRDCASVIGPLTVPEYTGNIGGSAFRNCTSLTEISFLATGTIWESMCEGCTSLVTATLKSANLDNRVFYGCTSLQSLTILRAISVGNKSNQFYQCSNLKRVDVASMGVWIKSSFGTGAKHPFGVSGEGHLFVNGVEITEVGGSSGPGVIPSDVTSVPTACFLNCESITKITIPSNITSIAGNAFQNTGITELIIPNTVTSLGADFIAYTQVESLTIPSSITTLPAYFMDRATGLKTLILEEGVQSAGNYFIGRLDTSWTYIDIPSTFISFGTYAFQRSGSNPIIVCRATTPPTFGNNSNAFSTSVKNTLKIYVPYSSDGSILASYKAAGGWSNRASAIYELNSDGTIPT